MLRARLIPMAPDPRTLGQPCADCQAGPAGIAGHDQLFSHTMGSDRMHFRCRGCGALWVRRSAAMQRFDWSRSDEVSGTDTPGRPGTAPP